MKIGYTLCIVGSSTYYLGSFIGYFFSQEL